MPRRRAETPRNGRRMVQIYLPRTLAEKVRVMQEERDLSNAELILNAIEATHEELAGLIAAESAIKVGGLFSREYRPRREAEVGSVQIGVRLAVGDIALIDELVSSAQARSRSAYIVTALRAFLSQQKLE